MSHNYTHPPIICLSCDLTIDPAYTNKESRYRQRCQTCVTKQGSTKLLGQKKEMPVHNQPILHMELLCGYNYCSRPLKLVSTSGTQGKYVYKCSYDHLNEIPTEVEGTKVAKALGELNQVLADHTNTSQRKESIKQLEAQKKTLEHQLAQLTNKQQNPAAPSSKK